MDKTKKCEKKAIVYLCLAVLAHSELRTSIFTPWLSTLDAPFGIYKHLFTLSFLGLYGVPFFMILDGKNLIQWREIMKTNFWGWFTLIASSVAFVVLMTEVCRCIEQLCEVVRVIIAASIIFIPNMWALTHLIGEKGKQDREKKSDITS